MNFKQFYRSGLYVQIMRHIVNPEILLKRQLFHLVDESNIGENCLVRCCQYGHLELLKRLIQTYKTQGDMIAVAIKYNQLKILKYLYNDIIILKNVELATKYNSSDILNFLYDKKPELFTVKLLDLSKSIDTIKFLYDRNIRYQVDENGHLEVLENFAKCGWVDIFRFLCEQHPDAELSNSYYNSIAYGCVDIFRYLFEEKCAQCDGEANAFVEACGNGCINIVQYLYEETNIRFSDDIIVEAIQEACNSSMRNAKELAIYVLNHH